METSEASEKSLLSQKKRSKPDEEDVCASLETESLLLSAKKARSESLRTQSSDDDTEEEDEFDAPQDMEDYLDEETANEEEFSDTNSVSTTGSVGSNTPSLVGENLETISLADLEKTSSASNGNGSRVLYTRTECPLTRSLFAFVPPSLHFVGHNEQHGLAMPTELRKNLRWKLSTITPAVVKRVVVNSGFRLMRKNCSEWGGTWGKHMNSTQFRELRPDQKLNHFPGTFNIGRKDRLWRNYQKLRAKHGKSQFAFLPRTFCLPSDTKLLKKAWEKRGITAKWIVKPPALARGNGIKVINKWSQIPRTRPLVVQRYLSRPHLINETKYDLRIYVLVTSVCPLRIFLYDEGLVRFASNTYDKKNTSLSDVFMHLTNYSINKSSSNYSHNEDPDTRQGHKWKLSSLWNHFRENNIDQTVVWGRIKDLVIKTILSGDHVILPLFKSSSPSHYCGYELFGFDVLLDADLKPWLIEVNISPSLHSSSPLDLEVKGPMAAEMFNIARYHVPATNNRMSDACQREAMDQLGLDSSSPLCFDHRLYVRELSKADRTKQENILNLYEDRDAYTTKALEELTSDDVRFLIRAEDELANAHHFHRIFPTNDTHVYLKYLGERPNYYYLLFDAWECRYASQRSEGIELLRQLCLKKVHLKVPASANHSSSENKKKAGNAKLRKKIDVSGLLKTSAPATTAVVPSNKCLEDVTLKASQSNEEPGQNNEKINIDQAS